ncbi:MAG: tyrosine-type recombinase/integrase [Symploca sp. SIO1C4]|uniref:Tyrosine-type recombinase/integrase n=1 Tax=Symploca sp. SIO1C4 TaxID=2607765 RepID=A0A6B3N9J0_9CYAN|nr:tyrosine-type recombinase/integrase [Symploca sp. SIO1C4]
MSTNSQHNLNLETSLNAKIERHFDWLDTDPDVLQQLLDDKRSANTRLAYHKDVTDFFRVMTGGEPTTDAVLEFLHLERKQAVAVVLKYKAKLIQKGLKETTVNRRLAALKSLVAMGRQLGVCDYSLEEVKGEKVQNYRDTTGIEASTYKKLLNICDRNTLKGKRDYALLRLLWDNALRRSEVVGCDICDLEIDRGKLAIKGKGKGSNKELISLVPPTIEALQDYLQARGVTTPKAPLFIALDNARKGHRLSATSLYRMVDAYSKKAGLTKKFSPHRVRHSAITEALNKTNGNVRAVQRLSRHSNIATVQKYDDNRLDLQGDLSQLLAQSVE